MQRRIRVIGLGILTAVALLVIPALAAPLVQVTAPGADAATQRVSVDAVQADVKVVLRALADVGKLSVVFADGCDGRVTVVLRDVPLADAMDSVAWAAGLGVDRQGPVRAVRPGPPSP